MDPPFFATMDPHFIFQVLFISNSDLIHQKKFYIATKKKAPSFSAAGTDPSSTARAILFFIGRLRLLQVSLSAYSSWDGTASAAASATLF
jgi:hypothetical protein